MVANNTEIEKRLWNAADELRANSGLKSQEYSTPVLGLIFLRYADAKFAAAEKELAGKASERRPVGKLDYQARGVMYLPEAARFSRILGLPEGADVGAAINDAMRAVEAENEELRDVLPKTYNRLENRTLVELLRLFASIEMDAEGDVFGKIYEYFLSTFAAAEGQKGGEFFTPTSIVKLIVDIIEPFHGRIFDPACGSGGMFVQSARFVERHRQRPSEEIMAYGQEKTSETVRLCKMNLAVHGLSGDIREGNSYYEDIHESAGRFDFVMANPPFNVDRIDKERLKGDERFPFGLPRVDNGNYIWIQLFLSALAEELDGQIYGTFQRAGVVTEGQVQARSSPHLRELLGENHRYIFTLVQKFRTDKGQKHPVVSERSDIIVIADEAHRSQYDTFAANMRDALPNAAFIAFTGTPLMAGEEKTREVFGDYVSVYDFEQSVTDESTVPLFYENRIPELQLTNQDLRDDIYRVLDDADLGEVEERAVERAFAREYNLITRNDRLETIAEDIIEHFYGRGFPGKAMVVCIDKATAVRMYDKVQKYWRAYVEKQAEIAPTDDFARTTDMAVVVSSSQNEVEDLAEKGADIRPHRARMNREDLAEKFKKPDDPLRIVFVCAMWMTGFDAPSCSTIYLDKPMRNHTLMQTIARANRVFKDKTEGTIVDYIGVFRDLEKALAIYAPAGRDVLPVREKAVLVARLKEAVEKATAFLIDAGVDPEPIMGADGFEKIALMDEAVEAIVVNEESKSHFASLVAAADRAHRSVMPDPAAGEFRAVVALLLVLHAMVRNLAGPVDVSMVMDQIEEILEESVTTEPYTIAEKPGASRIDLSKLDFKALQKRFAEGRRNSAVEHLKGQIGAKLAQMVRLNRSRMDYLEKFQTMIDEYNAGSVNVQLLFDELLAFTEELDEEDRRYIKEDLAEEELAVFDLLTKPDMSLTKKEQQAVKDIARQLLDTLNREKLVLDWRKRQQSRAAVRVCIEESLDLLPGSYGSDKYRDKCNAVYDHVYDSYFGEGKSVYRAA